MPQETRVPLLRQDGAHTRYVRGGVKPDRSSSDLRPPSLSFGETSMIDFLNEGPPPGYNAQSTAFATPETKPDNFTKEHVGSRISTSIRKIFSPKQRSTESKQSALELLETFKRHGAFGPENWNSLNTFYGSDSTLSSTAAEMLERDLLTLGRQPASPPVSRCQNIKNSSEGVPNTAEGPAKRILQQSKCNEKLEIKNYADGDPMTEALSNVTIEEAYGGPASIDLFAPHSTIEAAIREAPHERTREKGKSCGLDISSYSPIKSRGSGDKRQRRANSDESFGSAHTTPLTPTSGYITPPTPTDVLDYYSNFPKILSEAHLRSLTGTEAIYRSPGPGHPKHPNHGREFHSKNLQCTDHMGHCSVCKAACCVYLEAIEASNKARTSSGKEFAFEIVRTISQTCVVPADVSTFLRCSECSRMTCPECIGICPERHCQIMTCKPKQTISSACVPSTIPSAVRKSIRARYVTPIAPICLLEASRHDHHRGSLREAAFIKDPLVANSSGLTQGKLYVRGDSKIFRFQNGKTESLFLQRKNPRRIAWTVLYRRQHKKGISEEIAKKRTRRTVKQQRGIVGASLDVIKERRSQRPEARTAARQEAIKAGKEKKAEAESKKRSEKAKSAAGAARGQGGRMVSKQGAKGAPAKASGKVR
ncbi:MAG: hypothetical protein Q9200_000272 [Gallowayella weberi]